MAATYHNLSEPHRDSLRSAQSSSIYSTSSSAYLEPSPLDSIIRNYPTVPGASPNAFNFSPATSSSAAQTTPASFGKFQQSQPQPRGAGVSGALDGKYGRPMEQSPMTPRRPDLAAQTHERTGSSPILHARFHSPAETMSSTTYDARRNYSPEGGTEDNFIDLRDSGVYTPEEMSNPLHTTAAKSQNFYRAGHGVPQQSGHGVTPVFNYGVQRAPENNLPSRFSPMTPDEDPEINVGNSRQASQPPSRQEQNMGLNPRERNEYFDRGSWTTQYTDDNAARQTWMTTTSGMTLGDPFSFRHFESPHSTPNPTIPNYSNTNAPSVVIHGPDATSSAAHGESSQYSTRFQGYQPPITEEREDPSDTYAYLPPSPLDPPVQGRAPSKVPVANGYNFSRPLRSDRTSQATSSNAFPTSARGSEYSTVSSSELPYTISGFPEPPIPEQPRSLPYQQQAPQNNGNTEQLSRRATARMSIPKTIPNFVFTDDQLSPSPSTMEISNTNSPRMNPAQLSDSQGRPGPSQPNLGARSLSPIRDRSPSPSDHTHSYESSSRYQAPSPLPGPPKSYNVPYTYNVTITDRQHQGATFAPNGSSSSHSGHSINDPSQTRYSMGGTALPPAPKEVVALPSSPPPIGPRPGSGLSVYSKYSFYSVGDLPGSGATTPRGWDKDPNARRSPSSGDRTPTPTKGGPKSDGNHQNLAYLNTTSGFNVPGGPVSAGTTGSAISPQESLMMGITNHEANKLEESAYWFEKAANDQGGCPVGMLMWGLSLRHGWGVPKDERSAFWWLRRAAECAVEDLEKATAQGQSVTDNTEKDRDRKAVQSELVLAVYEVGQCFFHGWGVQTDKKMAVSYFQVAARLGDVDAQLELGFCFANGKGCKKDLKEAARWYRAAAAQGASTVGLAWIYKPKYGGGESDEKDMGFTGRPLLPSSNGAPSVKSGKSDGPRKLKKPPPRSRTPSARSRSPARTEGTGMESP
ncbi:hypothetical protein CPB86DRAFT_735543 [Serendipita vermifera]|nr:hypothetical protein CPB86DRAFT_735543 [Serendipita vermifera]